MKQVTQSQMIRAVYKILNDHPQNEMSDLYFQTLVDKFKLIDPDAEWYIQTEEAFAILKGMILSAVDEGKNHDMRGQADYTINRIQVLSEELFGIRFVIGELSDPHLLHQLHSDPQKSRTDLLQFDTIAMISFMRARDFMIYLRTHAKDILGCYNAYRSKDLGATVHLHQKPLFTIGVKLQEIYCNQKHTLFDKVREAKKVFDDISTNCHIKTHFKRFCYHKSEELTSFIDTLEIEYGIDKLAPKMAHLKI